MGNRIALSGSLVAAAADTRPAIGGALVRRLVDSQFPKWAELPLRLALLDGAVHRSGFTATSTLETY